MRVRCKRPCDEIQLEAFGTIGWAGNSGFHALNLALQFGAAAIVLVGYDMRVDKGVHWHGKHGGGLNNPADKNVGRWRRAIDAASLICAELGVTVINASAVSALTAYRKMDFREALECSLSSLRSAGRS